MSRALLALVIYLVFTWACWPEVDINKYYITTGLPCNWCVTATLVVKVFHMIHVKCCHGINNDLHLFVKRICIHCSNAIIHVTN